MKKLIILLIICVIIFGACAPPPETARDLSAAAEPQTTTMPDPKTEPVEIGSEMGDFDCFLGTRPYSNIVMLEIGDIIKMTGPKESVDRFILYSAKVIKSYAGKLKEGDEIALRLFDDTYRENFVPPYGRGKNEILKNGDVIIELLVSGEEEAQMVERRNPDAPFNHRDLLKELFGTSDLYAGSMGDLIGTVKVADGLVTVGAAKQVFMQPAVEKDDIIGDNLLKLAAFEKILEQKPEYERKWREDEPFRSHNHHLEDIIKID